MVLPITGKAPETETPETAKSEAVTIPKALLLPEVLISAVKVKVLVWPAGIT